MAALDGFDKTSQNDLIEGVQIDAIIGEMHKQPAVFQDICWINPKVTKEVWRIGRNDLITVNNTLAEADEAAYTSFTTSATNITPAVYPVRSFISGELMADSAIDAVQKGVADHGSVIHTAIDANVLANISSAATTSDHTGTSLDKAKFEAALVAFKKQKPHAGTVIFVGGYKQIADILAAYGNSSGSVYGVPGVASGAVGAPQNGGYFRGTVAGVELYEAAVPASGGADVSGAFMIKNRTLALGFWNMLAFRLSDVNGRFGKELFTYSRYGTGIAFPANIREVISLA